MLNLLLSKALWFATENASRDDVNRRMAASAFRRCALRISSDHSYLPREGQAQSVRFVCDGFEYERDVCQSVDRLKGKQIAGERS